MLCTPHLPYHSGDQVKKAEMDRPCNTYGGRGAYRVLMGKPEGRNHLKDPGIDGRIILKMDLREVGCGSMDWSI